MEQQTKPTFQIPFGDYTATLEKGVWKYEPSNNIEKAKTEKPIAKYKDPFQFHIMEEYEGIAKSRYQKQLGEMVLEISKFLLSA